MVKQQTSLWNVSRYGKRTVRRFLVVICSTVMLSIFGLGFYDRQGVEGGEQPPSTKSGNLPMREGGQDEKPAEFQPDLATYKASVRPFLQRHCVSCHGEAKQESGLRLDTIEVDFGKSTVASRWTEIMDRMNAGEMPPKGKPRPDISKMTVVTSWIVGELRRREAAIHSTGGRVVLRRLNRSEYLNTMRDLFGTHIELPQDVPADPPAHGFDNIGAALQMSPLQIEKYIAAASDVLEQVIPSTPRPPKPIKWRFRMDDIYNEGEDPTKVYHRTYPHPIDWAGKPTRVKLFHNYEPKEPFPRRHQGMVTVSPRTSALAVLNITFPKGEYIVRIRAASLVPSREEVVQIALERLEKRADTRNEFDEFRRHFRTSLDYQLGPPRMRLSESGTRRVFAELDVDAPLKRPRVYEFRTRFHARSMGVLIGNYYKKPSNRAVNVIGGPSFPKSLLLIDYVEIEGPIADPWPPKSQTELLGPANDDERQRARGVLARFMPRAWRRSVTETELDAMVALFQRRRTAQPNFEEAIKVPLLAVLSSPNFLYLDESDRSRVRQPAEEPQPNPAPKQSRQLNDFQLASRLSYFLWSSMPDPTLLKLAQENRLSNRATLTAQVTRMLADRKADQFVTNFAGQWLGLRKIGSNPPSRDIYRRYDDHLEESLARETLGFFAEILHNDLDVRNFIESDFVTINERLARHYHIEGVRGDHIRRVAAPPNSHRGGLLTQASIHTLTSNGTRTSPVLRGKWILETLLGDPPPPPPPDAGDIPPKVPGAGQISVRRRLELHRQLPACAACHNKIDPLGFALENFRADGSWGEREATAWGAWERKTDLVLDTSAHMPYGQQIRGIEELQKALLQQEDKFLRHLVERLATYALGRGMEFSDRAWIDSLVLGMKQNKRTLRGLIERIVVSEQFRSK